MLEEFERIHPGLADRIVAMAEAGVKADAQDSKNHWRSHLIGQAFAFILTMTALGLGAFLVYNDKDIAGLIPLIGGIGVIVNSIIQRYIKK